MRLLIVALFCAISYAQTVIGNDVLIQDGTIIEQYNGICFLLENNNNSGCSDRSDQCIIAYCRESGISDECFVQGKEYGTPCTSETRDEDGVSREVRGVCVDGTCIFSVDAGECPDPILSAERTFPSCGDASFQKTWRFPQGDACLLTGTSCQDVASEMSNLECRTSQTLNDPEHQQWKIGYYNHDRDDKICIIGEDDECIISIPGEYELMGMHITWDGAIDYVNERTTYMSIPMTTMNLVPFAVCPNVEGGSSHCRGTIECQMVGPEPCGRVVETCDGTYPPTAAPVVAPTTNPAPDAVVVTTPPEASSFGDPIVWTFDGSCYDLNVDGWYLASSHKYTFDHDVYISVYNHYMREIQVNDKVTGEVILSINNLGEVINNFPFYFNETQRKCEVEKECQFFFKEYTFDAQQLEYVVQIQTHTYDDLALQEGEVGFHLDIYPRPTEGFRGRYYKGLYFDNPLPEENNMCAL